MNQNDNPTNPNPTPAPAPTPTPTNPTPAPAAPELPQDIKAKLEKAEKIEKEYQEYKSQVDPVLETLWADQDLLKKTIEVHNKRTGKVPAAPTDPNKPDNKPTDDTRASQVSIIQERFEEKVGINKITDPKKQGEVRGMVGQMLKEMLDPKGNKTIQQVFEEVNLVKLPWYLEKAYQLVNREADLATAKESGKNEVLSQYEEGVGVIGSMPGGSAPAAEMVLSAIERQTAKKMGISEEQYLKNKKEIASR